MQRIEGVPQQTVTPSDEHLERIRSEREKVRAAKSRRLPGTDGLLAVQQCFVWPVTGGLAVCMEVSAFITGPPEHLITAWMLPDPGNTCFGARGRGNLV